MNEVYCLKHIPVLLLEAIKSLNIMSSGIYIDCTFGMGGHTQGILSHLGDNGKLLVVDCDLQAVEYARRIFSTDKRVFIKHGYFSQVIDYVSELNFLGKVNGIILDLGVSSYQIDQGNRGFSFLRDGPLDMRMNIHDGLTAADWLASATLDEIKWVLRYLGEEKFFYKIAVSIVKERRLKNICTTGHLVALINKIVPINFKFNHPAARTFRAIRMYINKEIEEINQVLHSVYSILAPGGRMVIISFHSLEDRIVKEFVRSNTCNYSNILMNIPFTESQIEKLYFSKCLFRNVGRIIPSVQEKRSNPRSSSAVMRVIEKIGSIHA